MKKLDHQYFCLPVSIWIIKNSIVLLSFPVREIILFSLIGIELIAANLKIAHEIIQYLTQKQEYVILISRRFLVEEKRNIERSIFMSKSAWLVRPFPHNIKRLDMFKKADIIAIGWPGIGDLSQKSREGIKEILAGAPYQLKGLELGNAYATIDIFVNRMSIGDLVLIPDGDDIYFAEITSEYYLDAAADNADEGYPHQRTIKWLADTSRKNLSMPLRSSLKVHRATANLSEHLNEIEALSRGEKYDEELTQAISVSYPLRPDFEISFQLPSDITKEEAQRLSDYLRTLYFI